MPENKLETIKDLSFADLLALRDFYIVELEDAYDSQKMPKIDEFSVEMQRTAKDNIDRISKFIHLKFEKVKRNSMPQKS